MIRAALLCVTFGAGAASGSASAQSAVPAGPLLEICGGHVLTLEPAAPVEPVEPRVMQAAARVLDERVGGDLAKAFAFALVSDGQITLSVPAGLAGEQGSEALIAPPAERVEFAFYPVIARESSNVTAAAGQLVAPDKDDPQTFWRLADQDFLTAADLVDAAPIFDVNGMPAVSVRLSRQGAATIFDYTARHIGEAIAIVIDGAVVSAPTIRDAIYGAEVMISGSFTTDDATRLAANLRRGMMPFDVVVLHSETLDGSDPSASFCP